MAKNILIVTNSLGLGGGAERIAAEVGTNLQKREHNVTFLSRYDAMQKYEYEGDYIYRYKNRRKNLIKKFLRELKGPRRIAKVCKEKDISTVFSFSYSPNFCAILSKIIYGNEAKIMISIRNNPVRNLTKNLQVLSKMLYPKADKVIVQTKRIKNILNKKFSLNNCMVIPNMVNLKKYERLAKEEIPKVHKSIFEENDFLFITVGGLDEQKSQWNLIRCFKKVSQTKENTKLVILGDGELKDELVGLVKKMDIENKILFLGYVENVFPYLKHSDCFVFSSSYEGFPNALTEALSQNLPVISTDCISGPREILCPWIEVEKEIQYPYFGKYGILTKTFREKKHFKSLKRKSLSNQEKIFSEMMIEVRKNKELRQRYTNGLERLKSFKISNIMEKWENLV